MSVAMVSGAANGLPTGGRAVPAARRTAATGERRPQIGEGTDTIVHLSPEARQRLAAADGQAADPVITLGPPDRALAPMDWHRPSFESPDIGAPVSDGAPTPPEETETAPSDGGAQAAAEETPPSPQAQREIEQLRARDAEVRAHEAAHAGTGGTLAGRPSLEYTTGPDGKRYAVNGEVSIDTSPGRTPEETIARARTIRAAATAPASPSAQDMAVASSASQMEANARSQLRERQQTESRVRTRDVGHPDPGGAKEPASAGGASREARDPEQVLLELAGERASERGGMGHQHLAAPCGFCSRAASAYS